MTMAMAVDVLEKLGSIEEKDRGVAKERQTMLLLQRGLAGEPLSQMLGVREIARVSPPPLAAHGSKMLHCCNPDRMKMLCCCNLEWMM
jgi:hypothetical protein